MRRQLAAVALTILAACGGGGDPIVAPPGTITPAIARIVYATPSAMMFVGTSAPVSSLVQAFDGEGNRLPTSALDLSLSPGWTVRNDSVIAPSTERKGTLNVTPHGVTLDSVDVIVEGADSTELVSGIDFRDYDWTADWSCYPTPGKWEPVTADFVPIDSTRFHAARVDSVIYQGEVGWFPNYGELAQLWWTGTGHQWLSDGTERDYDIESVRRLWRQTPDTLVFETTRDKVVRSGAGQTYVGGGVRGGSWCEQRYQPDDGRGPVTLVGTPKEP